MTNSEYILSQTSHRPWPLPAAPWVMFQQWRDLLFAHWAVSPDAVRPLVSPELELDLYDGKAWLAITPFRMTDIRLRGMPAIPGAAAFLEMNFRTYVRPKPRKGVADADKPGIFFFSLDASSLLAVIGARASFGLPYFWSDMSATGGLNGAIHKAIPNRAAVTPPEIHYTSRRKQYPAEVDVSYFPSSDVIEHKSPLEIFLTERYCLYKKRFGVLFSTDIHHVPWPLQKAEAQFRRNTIGQRHGFEFGSPELLHFSRQIDVLVFAPRNFEK